MRKLIVSMNVTLDGFMAGPDSELDWHFERWNTEMGEYLSEELGRADTIILGRVTYNAMADYWPLKSASLYSHGEEIALADMMNSYAKVVFSRSLIQAHWKNSRVVNGNLKAEMARLKQQDGKDMILYGSGKLVSALIQEDLIDEYRLWIHPVLLGKGKPFFREISGKQELELIGKKIFGSGVVELRYERRETMDNRQQTNDSRKW